MRSLKNVLNGLKWDPRKNPAEYEIKFIHRGALGDVRTIAASDIRRIGKSWFTYSLREEEEVLIPFHRVVEVKNIKTGLTAWKSRRHFIRN
jgi:uncharacterized protein (UPF0248 family)